VRTPPLSGRFALSTRRRRTHTPIILRYQQLTLGHPDGPQSRSRQLTNVEAHITGIVWKIEVSVGDQVQPGDTLVILESMKMEMPLEAEESGVVSEIRCEEGDSVTEGDVLLVLQ
jgi:acetyl-CoA carboxylase biotin carboxyl carrier protein